MKKRQALLSSTFLTLCVFLSFMTVNITSYGQWTTNGNNIYKLTGNVGIGTSTPDQNLVLARAGATSYASFVMETYSTNWGYYPFMSFRKSNNNTLGIKAQTNSGDYLGALVGYGVGTNGGWAPGAQISFAQTGTAGAASLPGEIRLATSNGSSWPDDHMIINSEGSVGIGTMNPGAKLEINQGMLWVTGQEINNGNIPGLGIFGGNTGGGIYFRGNEENKEFLLAVHKGYIRFGVGIGGESEAMRITNEGNVGIGITNPSASLVVRGNATPVTDDHSVSIAGIDTEGNPVIELRGSGQTPFIDFSNDSITDYDMRMMLCDDDKLIFDGGSIGIGTANPTEKLDVNGNVKADTVKANYFIGDGSGLTGLPMSSYWGKTGDDLSYTTGNIGIGTTTPTEKLSVSGTIESTSGGFKFPDGTIQATAVNNTMDISWDFSTDPGWVSSDTSKMYFDSVNQSLSVTHYKPDANGIFYDLGAKLTGDFDLQFDVKLTRADFDINLWVGLASNQDYVETSPGTYLDWGNTKFAGINFLYVASHNGGKRFDLVTTDGSVSHDISNTIHWSTDVWYTVKLDYESSSKTLTLNVFQGESLVDSHQLPNYDLKSNNLRQVGVHMVGCNNNTTTVEAFIDNISISRGDMIVNHTATQNIQLASHWLSGDGDDEGVYVDNDGNVGMGTANPVERLDVNGNIKADTIKANFFVGDGSALTNLPMSSYWVKTGNDLSYTTGNIGIGKPASSEKLDIDGNIRLNSNELQFIDGNWGMRCENDLPLSTYLDFMICDEPEHSGDRAFRWFSKVGTTENLLMSLNGPKGGNIFHVTGSIGVGTTGPTEKLDVSGNINIPADSAYKVGGEAILRAKSTNLFVGENAGHTTTGDDNSFLGYQSGYSNTTGAGNVFLGYQAGYNETGSDKLYIENSNSATPLIYGEFDNNILQFNGNVGIGAAPAGGYALYVNGTTYCTSGAWTASDKRYKKNITAIPGALELVQHLQGTQYEFRTDEFKNKKLSEGRQYGFIAQDMKEVLPELVRPDEEGHYAINYDGVIPVLVEAMKEQQSVIEELKKEVTELKELIGSNSIPDNTVFSASGAKLYQNTPNPFNNQTEIRYFLSDNPGAATLLIFDMNGKQLKSYQLIQKGNGKVVIYGNDFRPGMYLYSLVANNKIVDTKRMILTE